MAGHGVRLNVNLMINQYAKLVKLAARGEIAALKTLSTAILTDATTINSEIQAATVVEDLSEERTITA